MLECNRATGHRFARRRGHGQIVDVIEEIAVDPTFPIAPIVMVTPYDRGEGRAEILTLRVVVIHRGRIYEEMRPLFHGRAVDEIAKIAVALIVLVIGDVAHQAIIWRGRPL